MSSNHSNHNAAATLVALLGPSGAGKTTLIRELCSSYDYYEYIKPFTTRELRQDETDKIHVDHDKFKSLVQEGNIMFPNHLYGNWYGPSRSAIYDSVKRGNVPLIDWPVQKIDGLRKEIKLEVFSLYIMPPDLETLKQRMGSDGRDKDGKRYDSAVKELEKVQRGEYAGIGPVIINAGDIMSVASSVHDSIRAYLIDKARSEEHVRCRL
jgi:guanylate kinase